MTDRPRAYNQYGVGEMISFRMAPEVIIAIQAHLGSKVSRYKNKSEFYREAILAHSIAIGKEEEDPNLVEAAEIQTLLDEKTAIRGTKANKRKLMEEAIDDIRTAKSVPEHLEAVKFAKKVRLKLLKDKDALEMLDAYLKDK